jgi:hypothetical protein
MVLDALYLMMLKCCIEVSGGETKAKQCEIITVFFHFHTVFTQIIYEISYNLKP